MKYTIRKITALIIALMLAMPGVVTADETIAVDNGAIQIDDAGIDTGSGLDLVLDGDGLTVEDFDGLLSDGINGLALDGLISNFEDDTDAPAPFEQTVKAGDVAFILSAEAGAFPEGASLRVSDILDETLSHAATDAAEAIASGEAKQHRLYQIEVIDRDENICPINAEMTPPSVCVEGLNPDEATKVLFYDPGEAQGREIETEIQNEKTFRFGFVGSGVYDIWEEMEDTSTPADGDTADEISTDQKPSPSGEGAPTGADEVGSSDDMSDSDNSDTADESSTDQKPSPDGGPSARESVQWTDSSEDGSEDPRNGGTAQSAVTDEVPSPNDSDTPDETDAAPQKPSPGGEGAEQSEADEVSTDSQTTDEPTDDETNDEGTSSGADAPPSPEGKAFGEQPADDQQPIDEQQPTDDQQPADVSQDQPADDSSTDQKPSPSGEGAPTGADEVGSPDDMSDSDNSDTADESYTDPQKPSPGGEGAEQSEADEVSTDGQTADDVSEGDTEDDTSTPDDHSDEQDQNGDTSSVSPDGEPASPQGEASDTPDGESDPDDTEADPQEPSPDGGPSARESVQWTDSSEDGSEDPRNGGTAQSAVTDEVPSPGDSSDTPDGESDTDTPSPLPVAVIFTLTPGDAQLTIHPVATNEAPESAPDAPEADGAYDLAPVSPEPDGTYLLVPGEYAYAASAEGYIAVEDVPFTVEASGEPLAISVTLEPEPEPEPVPFDQTMTVNGVAVTVRAPAGAFPANAALSVKRVPSYKVKQAGAAIEEVREDDQNVAVSYTFDIKVVDPDTNEALQPAGASVWRSPSPSPRRTMKTWRPASTTSPAKAAR